jgi:Ca2+-binding RTX toxin-like protein
VTYNGDPVVANDRVHLITTSTGVVINVTVAQGTTQAQIDAAVNTAIGFADAVKNGDIEVGDPDLSTLHLSVGPVFARNRAGEILSAGGKYGGNGEIGVAAIHSSGIPFNPGEIEEHTLHELAHAFNPRLHLTAADNDQTHHSLEFYERIDEAARVLGIDGTPGTSHPNAQKALPHQDDGQEVLDNSVVSYEPERSLSDRNPANSGGNDWIGTDGDDFLGGSAGDDYIYGDAGSDRLFGGHGNDVIVADFLDLLSDEQAQSLGVSNIGKVRGGPGIDTLIITGDQGVNMNLGTKQVEIVHGSGGNDRLSASGVSTSVVISGAKGNDVVTGGSADDFLDGGNGTDRLYGGSGGDLLYGQEGNDELSGGNGSDYMTGGEGTDTLYGGDGTDELHGNEGSDKLYGENGNDKLWGHDGNDRMYGGDGDDYLTGGNDDELLYGGAGADHFRYYRNSEADRVMDFENNVDTISFGGFGSLFGSWYGAKQYAKQVGSDVVFNFGGGHTFTIENTTIGYLNNDAEVYKGGAEQVGTSGNNTLSSTTAADALYGLGGADTLSGGNGNDFLYGGDANDRLYGGNGTDHLVGGAGNDYLRDDSTGKDYFYGGAGTDTVSYYGRGSGVSVNLRTRENSDGDGYSSIEDILGTEIHNDSLWGSDSANKIQGAGGNDKLWGHDGNDRMYGGDGDDYLNGGNGDDLLYGGTGADHFRFYRNAENDRIMDFENNVDTISLANFSFANVADALAIAQQDGGDVVFDFGTGGSLTVENTTISSLTDDLALV